MECCEGGGYRLMHPFHPLDDLEEVMYDVYTTTGTLHWVGPSVEVLMQCLLTKLRSHILIITSTNRQFSTSQTIKSMPLTYLTTCRRCPFFQTVIYLVNLQVFHSMLLQRSNATVWTNLTSFCFWIHCIPNTIHRSWIYTALSAYARRIFCNTLKALRTLTDHLLTYLYLGGTWLQITSDMWWVVIIACEYTYSYVMSMVVLWMIVVVFCRLRQISTPIGPNPLQVTECSVSTSSFLHQIALIIMWLSVRIEAFVILSKASVTAFRDILVMVV